MAVIFSNLIKFDFSSVRLATQPSLFARYKTYTAMFIWSGCMMEERRRVPFENPPIRLGIHNEQEKYIDYLHPHDILLLFEVGLKSAAQLKNI